MSRKAVKKVETNLPLNERLWTHDEARAFLGLTKSSYYRALATEDIPCLKIGSKTRFIPEQLMAWAKKKTAS